MAIKKNSRLYRFQGTRRLSGFNPYEPYTQEYVDTMTMETFSHPGWRSRTGSGDVGGPWSLSKVEHRITPCYLYSHGTGPDIQGPFVASQRVAAGSITPSNAASINKSTLVGLGTTAIARSLPTNPSTNLAVTLGELKSDGVPTFIGSGLLKERAKSLRGLKYDPAKGAAQDYLSYQFGWKPMMADLLSFVKTVRDSHEIIEQYRKDSDKKIRRRYVFPPTQSSQISNGRDFCLDVSGLQGNAYTTQISESRSWFSGAFRYYVPVGNDLASKLARYKQYADKLYGIELTPEVVWNLAPWSWAADWFSNTGDVMHNISRLGQDGLAMQYGYMMSSNETTYTHVFKPDKGSQGTFVRVSKNALRLPASPYGFSVSYDGLSNRQKAITAALGITRVR